MRCQPDRVAPLGLLAALLFAACDDSPLDARPVRLGEPFVVAVGETVDVRNAGVRVGLLEVSSDTRCPIDVVCAQVFPGAATIRVSVEIGTIPAALLELDSTSDTTARGTYAGFEVIFTAIAPPQRSDRTIPQGEYRVTLVVNET